MMIPSAPLSSRARALISRFDFFPTRVTLSVIEGDHIFRIVSLGTGSESMVSSKENRFTKLGVFSTVVLTDSTTVGRFKNPH
jgi:hypothetical protein